MDPLFLQYIGKKKNLRDVAYTILSDPEKAKGFHYKFAYVWMSSQCNSKCRHCYQDGGPEGVSWSYKKADKVTDLLLEDGYIVNPIVNEWLPALWDLLKILKKCQVREISTNGIVITTSGDAFFERLRLNSITDIRHTLFPPGLHELITGRNRQMALEAIAMADQAGFRNVVNYVVSRETLPHITAFCAEIRNMPVAEVQFLNLFSVNRAEKMKKSLLTQKEIGQFWKTWEALHNDPRNSDILFDFQANFGPNPVGDNIYKQAALQKKFCLAGCWDHGCYLYITPQNEIYPCATLQEPMFKIGRIVKRHGGYAYELNANKWEEKIPGFDRSQCATLAHTLETI